MISERGRNLIIWMTVFTVLTLGTGTIRFLALRRQRRATRADDWLVVVATIAMLAMEGCTFWAIHNGLGGHFTPENMQLNMDQLIVQFKLQFSANITWTFSTVCCKLAILRFYLVIFPSKQFKYMTWVTMALCVVYAFGGIISLFFACKPITASWDPAIHATACWDWKYHSITATSYNMMLDIVIVCLPLPVLWGIQMPLRKRIAVSAMFSLGLLVVAVMLWRLVDTVRPVKNADYPYILAQVALQAHLECWLGLIAANLPSIAPVIGPMVPRWMKSYFVSVGSRPRPSGAVGLKTFGSSGQNTAGRSTRSNPLTNTSTIDGGDQEPFAQSNNITVQRDIEILSESSSGHSQRRHGSV